MISLVALVAEEIKREGMHARDDGNRAAERAVTLLWHLVLLPSFLRLSALALINKSAVGKG
eukprot:scaffold1684_cov214-Amphora_coffeaeformis.AAC.23